MFQSSPVPSDRNSSDLCISQLRDGLESITHRVGELQSLLSKKMDRSECLSICQKKSSHGQLRRSLEQLQGRIREEKNQEVERNMKMQEIAIDKINQLSKRLKSTQKISKQQSKGSKDSKGGKDSLKRAIQPQQLFIESNETMFSLLIEEIYKLQSRDEDFERQLELRNKKIVALNNEVCNKIEKLEADIDEKVKFNHSLADSKVIGNTWSHIERTNNKATVHKCPGGESGQFESFRWDMLSKNIETLQKQVLGKINIKDLLPVIKQNCQPLSESLNELREYVEQTMESTKRILSSQTEINKEISLGVKVAWWHSFQQEHHFALINKEIINLIPQILQIGKGSPPNFIKVLQQGVYLLKIQPIQNSGRLPEEEEQEGSEEDDAVFEVMVDTDVVVCGRESALRLQKNSEVRVIQRFNKELMLCLQKL